MQKVISINLNGNAYQVEEQGYDLLREYLARAERELKDNPDRAEIMADLEQAVADKCQKYLAPHKSVVTTSEVSQIVAEMGPVSTGSASGEPSDKEDSGTPGGGQRGTSTPPPPKRLYRIVDGAMIAGVCNGLAAYFHVDVTLIRVGFVVVALITKGVAILAYVVAMFVVPEANTPEEQAAAGGAPFNAKEVVDRVKRQYGEGSKHWNREWRRHRREWRRRRRDWQRFGWTATAANYPPPPAWSLVVVPLFALVHMSLFLAAAAMMISLVNTRSVFSWRLPEDVPVWVGALILFIGYQTVVAPFRAVQHWAWRPGSGAATGWFAFWHAAVWLVGLAVVVWVASNNIPEVTEFMQRLPHLFREMSYAIRDFFRP
jgi:phage shock protein PspC (stress-responsive transcriptional regulator)